MKGISYCRASSMLELFSPYRAGVNDNLSSHRLFFSFLEAVDLETGMFFNTIVPASDQMC